MMDNTLLIHMGRPKTGTTAIQKFLYENRANLEEYGWCYPDLSGELPEIRPYVTTKEKNGFVFFQERERIDTTTENWNKVWECVLKHLDNRNVIISAEEMFVWDTDKFLKGAKERYDNIKVLIYLRRQDRAIESDWNQLIKGPVGYSKTFQEFVDSDGEGTSEERLHYLGRLKRISGIIGKENLIVRVYEKQQFCGEKHTLESDFLSVLDIEPDWGKWKDCSMQNPRLNGNYLEIKRLCNSVMDAGNLEKNKKYTAIFKKFAQDFARVEEEAYFTLEERKIFCGKFASENEQIAREYLNREDGILFYDNRMDYPLCDIHQCSSFEEDLIRTFATMIYRQDERVQAEVQRSRKMCVEIQRLKNHNYVLMGKMLLHNMRGRQLLLFGAGSKCRELLKRANLPVTLITDNDEKKNGEIIGGAKVVHTKNIEDWTNFFVVVTCVVTDEIEEQLQMQGLKKDEDYALAKEYFMYD